MQIELTQNINRDYRKATGIVLSQVWKIKKITSLTATLTQNGNSVPPQNFVPSVGPVMSGEWKLKSVVGQICQKVLRGIHIWCHPQGVVRGIKRGIWGDFLDLTPEGGSKKLESFSEMIYGLSLRLLRLLEAKLSAPTNQYRSGWQTDTL